MRKYCKAKAIIRIILAVVGAALLVAAIASAQILSCYFDDDDIPADAVVVILGCGLSPLDHTAPSGMLGWRLEAAERYIAAHPNAPVILSGGQGTDEKISEAEAMYRWFEARGYDMTQFSVEDKSNNTATNLEYSARFARGDAVIVTDGFHQFRAHFFAKKYGFTPYSVSSYAPAYLQARYWLRELGGVVIQVWLGIAR
ncbi:MAG: YdcF family protein [Oscillospiraceae bacterium]|jgi:uncharacterized SAM-binding protein YcdF (DUF218 family)|nr:YdcF family protein [Oscillospiraceae bacterium]